LDIRRREGGREGEVVLHGGGNVSAAKGVLCDLHPLGDSPCRSWPIAARVCQKYCPQRNLKASSLGSSLLCQLNQLEVRQWAMM